MTEEMTEEECLAALQDNIDVGFITQHADGMLSTTEAGRAFVEQVISPNVEDRAEIFALGRLQGLREAEALRGTG